MIVFLLLIVLYFPLGFYTLKSTKFNGIYSILLGLFFGSSLISLLLRSMNVDLSIVLLLILIVLYIMAASLQAISYRLFSKTEGQILMYNYEITIRYLVFFAFMLYALLTYNFRL